jgi:hypothetical protein
MLCCCGTGACLRRVTRDSGLNTSRDCARLLHVIYTWKRISRVNLLVCCRRFPEWNEGAESLGAVARCCQAH